MRNNGLPHFPLFPYRWTVPSEYLRAKGWRIQQAVEQGRDWIADELRLQDIPMPKDLLTCTGNLDDITGFPAGKGGIIAWGKTI